MTAVIYSDQPRRRQWRTRQLDDEKGGRVAAAAAAGGGRRKGERGEEGSLMVVSPVAWSSIPRVGDHLFQSDPEVIEEERWRISHRKR